MLREYYYGLGEIGGGFWTVRSTCYCFSISRKSQNFSAPKLNYLILLDK